MKRAEDIEVITIKIEDDGQIPNHPAFPLLIYKSVFEEGDDIPATPMKCLRSKKDRPHCTSAVNRARQWKLRKAMSSSCLQAMDIKKLMRVRIMQTTVPIQAVSILI